MVQSPEERGHAPQASMSQSEGGFQGVTDGLSPNADVQHRAMQRYQRLLESDPQLQEHAYDQEKVAHLVQNCHTSVELLREMCKVYAERPMYGFCEPGSCQWQTITYKQAYQRVEHLAAGIQAVGGYKREDFVGICGFSSLDWITADYANTYCGVTTVPLPTNIQAEDIVKIINEAELTCLVCSLAELGNLAALVGGCETVKTFIVMDLPPQLDSETEALLQKTMESLRSDCKFYMLPDLLAKGRQSPAPKMAVPGQDGVAENPIYSLFYTSGSTGLPKGAIYREKTWVQYLKGAGITRMPIASITLGFLPLNHLMGRMSMNQSLMAGGSAWFLRKSDMSTFFEDVKTVRPTAMMIIPRIANMVYDQAQERLRKAKGSDKQAVLEDFVEKELGGRVLTCMTGSAPTAPEVIDFLRDTLVAPILEGYGSTEAGMITRDWMMSPNVTEWKLVDVPELGYFTTDKPFPRGELLLKTKSMISGYYKHQDKWDEMLRDGFMETGDVMEQRGPNTVVWIDRKKNIMKLSQGEFVSTGRLEATYSGNSDLIHQMYIYGSSLRSYLLATVIPSPLATSQYSGAELKRALRRDIDDLARTKALQGYEIPRDFIVDMEPFSKANHLITDSGKPARGKLKAKYGPVLEEMYSQMERRQRERQSAMRDAAAQGTVLDKVKQAASVTLGIDPEEMGDSSASFNQLGGDSLAAIQFAREVDELCGTHLPVSFVLDHSHSIQDIVDKVEDLLRGDEPDAITFERIHGRSSNIIQAKDLDLHTFAPRDFPPQERANGVAGQIDLPAEPERVLLTGANGFLGRFLLLDFLQRVSTKKDGYVVAVVRATSDEAAFLRLRAGYDSGAPDLLEAFDALAKKHLRVYTGDLSKPNLGLKPDIYQELAQSLDTVIHNGALVNHAFTYEQLFEPNVLGSLQMMKLAVSYRRKALTFVSSVGVAGPLGIKKTVQEDTLGTDLATEFPASGGYAYGYGCTKWATEVQLQQLHREYGVPVSVFRCGMILAHSRYLGQQNPTDMFTRLLASLVYTGIAPQSFYRDPNGPDRHYDGMPVDYVAEGIAGVASAQRRGIGLYHVVNPHWDDNVSLDSFLGWIQNAGYTLQRIPDYAQWYGATQGITLYQQFKAALEKLDSSLAGNSSLPIVHQWEHQMDGPRMKFDATEMRKRVAETTRWKDVPHLDEAFIRQNMQDLVALQIIGPPGKPHPQTRAAER